MSLSGDLKIIGDAISDRRSLKNISKDLGKKNKEEMQIEKFSNSIAVELINIFSAVKSESLKSNVDLDSFIIRPKKVGNKIKGTYQDPRVLIRAASKSKEFSKNFDLKIETDDNGQEQYKIIRKKISL